jgi:hypothetical protein
MKFKVNINGTSLQRDGILMKLLELSKHLAAFS